MNIHFLKSSTDETPLEKAAARDTLIACEIGAPSTMGRSPRNQIAAGPGVMESTGKGVGSGGSVQLKTATAFDDGAVDVLTGGTGQDGADSTDSLRPARVGPWRGRTCRAGGRCTGIKRTAWARSGTPSRQSLADDSGAGC